MQIDISTYLNPKINHHCLLLFENKHFTECAHTAMKQVEINLNKKVGINRFALAATTIKTMFSSGKGVRLRVPLGKNQQKNAKVLFKGAFKYYRNYTAHNQEHIDDKIALRVMVLASELLDLLDCCTLDLEELGGVDEIINIFQIQNKNRLNQLLTFIDGQYIIEDISDGLFEDLASNLRSISFRQFTATDSTRWNLSKKFALIINAYIKITDQGDLNWDDFAERPTRYLEEIFATPKVGFVMNNALFALGIRYFSLNTFNYDEKDRIPDTQFLTVGPLLEIIVGSPSLYLKVNSWYEFISVNDVPDRERANLIVEMSWKF